MHTTQDLRDLFLNFFARHDHRVVASSSLIPQEDPSLLFTNAGMVPFKNFFTGKESPTFFRASSCQKCLRAGGKHNDLENVGYTARHHTFFEMLGNFSFGDYFKEQAIEFAWRFITEEVGINPQRLCVTVYAQDEEAALLWKRISGLEERRIIPIATADNFWSMGDTGPCGPCSEIFYDHGENIAGGPPGSPEADGDRFTEIWNLVFMQFEQISSGKRVLLPKPSIDTGMGLERLSAVLQGVHDNYDTDILKSLTEKCAELTAEPLNGPHKFSHRVIADHLRSTCFLIADGILPSNEGRGYVLRRILRRALRHTHRLGYKKGSLLADLFPVLTEKMGAFYPELVRAASLITQTLKQEDNRFQQTLEKGLALLEDELRHAPEGELFSGKTAFKLYDTYGFPLDLTQDVLRERNRFVDIAQFNAAMDQQKAEARASWVGSGETAPDALFFDIQQTLGQTEFLGYTHEKIQSHIGALIVNDQPSQSVENGQSVVLIARQTPFYAESGGQKGDKGKIISADGSVIRVTDTQKKNGLIAHLGIVEKGKFHVEETVTFSVDGDARKQLKANHSATHLLHAALRDILGAGVTQKGSSVEAAFLRFDFSAQKPLSKDELSQVEDKVNEHIRLNAPVVTDIMSVKDALSCGAMALFGEKYGDEVRVVSMGYGGKTVDENPSFSLELCGGTHVERTGDIGFFKILQETSVSSGVRRIMAVTGQAAQEAVRKNEAILKTCADLLKAPAGQLEDRLLRLLDERKRLEKETENLRQQEGGSSFDILDVAGVNFLAYEANHLPFHELKPLMDRLKKQVKSGVVFLVQTDGKKTTALVGVTADCLEKMNAISLIQPITAALGGKGGGGRPDLAQAGGPETVSFAALTNKIKAAMLQK